MHSGYWRRWAVVGVLLGAATLSQAQTNTTSYDVIIRGGTVIDGTGAPGIRADVAIVRGHVAKVGTLTGQKAASEIDATGLYVTPGFINIHSHATPEGLQRAENMLAQGVTTEIINADGSGPTDLDNQLHRLRIAGLAVNVGANIGFNAIWASVMGPTDRRPTPQDIEKMRGMVLRGLEQGAYGVSSGLDYKPGYYASAEEVARVIDVARPWRTSFPNHDRLTPESNYSSRVGVAETIAIAGRSGLVPIVTHMKAQGREQGSAPELLKMMDEATAKGTYTAADVYPYLAGQSGLAALMIPGWALEGGREAMLERFGKPDDRARIIKDAESAMQARFGGPQGVYATGQKKELADAMKEFGVTSPGEALIRLLQQQDDGAILRFGIESDLVAILKHPNASVACDCGAAVPGTATHPRFYGSFPRVLGRYVREQKALTWEEAIRKMTSLPAATIGLVNRGVIAPGMTADIAIFDPATVIDRATFEAPTVMPEGVRYVLVNGKLAWRDGAPTGDRAGAVLLRGPHEPSRASSMGIERKVSGRADAEVDLNMSIEQAPGGRAARGRVRFLDRTSKVAVEMLEPGLLQVAPGWAAITGRGRIGTDERAITVLIERADPLDERHSSTITIMGEDGYQLNRLVPIKTFRVSPSR